MRILSVFVGFLLTIQAFAQAPVVIENDEMTLTVGADGIVRSLFHKPSGIECLDQMSAIPLCEITQYRPYDNENFLMFPAKPRRFPSNKVEMSGDTLLVEFADTYDIAKILVNTRPEYISFSLVGRDYRIEDFGVKRKTELDEFTLLQLPVNQMSNFGEWLNVVWNDSIAVALLGTTPETFIDSEIHDGNITLKGSTHTSVKLMGPGVALIAAQPSHLLNHIDALERDYDMPRGVASRRDAHYKESYYELRDFSLGNIDRNIELAKQGGFKTVMIYYRDFAKACGHFQFNDAFPGGVSDLKEITRRICQAGLIPALHIHYSKVEVDDEYICSGRPDHRINTVTTMTLLREIGESDTTLYLRERPVGLRMEDDRRLLLIDDELIMFSDISDQKPYRLTGCKRGVYNSHVASHKADAVVRHLDVDDWPIFLRIDQNSDIQSEIASRLADLYRECGFHALYFDGAEDVPMPYWYNVTKAQLEVYDSLATEPLWCEGAQKSHYGWHILSRGNAFDIFRPERLRQGMKKYTLRCARQVACDFSSVNFGWLNYLAPDSTTIGIQPDMIDFVCSKALAWDAPYSLVANLQEIERHPLTADNFMLSKAWEEMKLNGSVPDSLKILMRDPEREWTVIMYPDSSDAGYRIHEVQQITSDIMTHRTGARAFLDLDASGPDTTTIIFWEADNMSLPSGDDMNVTLLRGKRKLLTIPLPRERALKQFDNYIKAL